MASSKKNNLYAGHRSSGDIQLNLTSSESFKCEPVFALIEETLKKGGDAYVKKIQGIFAMVVSDGPGGKTETWVIDAKNGSGSVQRGSKAKADCTIKIKDKDLLDIARGKLQLQSAYFSGKMKIVGNMSTALKLQQIIPKAPLAKL